MHVYQVTVGERAVRVSLRSEADGVFVGVDDGAEIRTDLRHLHGSLHSLTLGDAQKEVLAVASDGGAVRLAIDGLEYEAEVVDEARARLASVAGARATSHTRLELKAPMPGLLVKLLCKVGDDIAPGQPLAVLQAMKMENELSLPRGGKVTQVKAEPGKTVEQGQVLIVIE